MLSGRPAGSEAQMNSRNTVVRIVAVALLLYSLASLFTVSRELGTMKALRQTLETELAALRQERQELEAKLTAYGEEAEMRRLAWERLGMVAPGEIVYYFNSGTD